MQHPFHLMPDMMVGAFRIQARLGAGGFGAVFRVECGGEQYALKFAVHGPGSEDLNRTDARARRELALLLLVNHPHVVRVWAHGRWPHPRTGYHYVVMDYVEGLTLTEWVRQRRPPLRQVLHLFDTLALTLDALHAQGIHHRDLKGDNILVRGQDEAPVLVDFGAGEHGGSAAPLTEGPLPPGTPHLRTPEALRFHRERYADPHARYLFRPTDDLYALGATLYEVLTGTPPFPPTLPREVLTALIEKEMPASPAVLNPQVPPSLGALVLRLLAKRPEERPASGQVLHELLQALLRDAPASLEVPLSPGAHAATTEGTGGPAVTSSADDPERPLSGREEEGGPVPTGPVERASPGSPSRHGPRWVAALASFALLGLLGAVLWWADLPTASLTDEQDAALGAPCSALLAQLLCLPPSPSPPREDASPATLALFVPDLGSPAGAGMPFPLLPKKGLPMRPSPLDHPALTPAPPDKDRSPGSSALRGLLVACSLTAGCASTDAAVRGPPPQQPCVPGAEDSMREALGGDLNRSELPVIMPGATLFSLYQEVTVTEGIHAVEVYASGGWGRGYPDHTRLVGEFFIRDKLYARFVEAILPNGRHLPFCGYLAQDNDPGEGVTLRPGSSPGKARVLADQLVDFGTYQPW